MLASWDDWLSVVQPHFQRPLFSEESLERARFLARRLPGTDLLILELRLGWASGIVDLSLRVREPAQARALAEILPVSSPAPDFLRRWSDPEGPFRRIPSLWLEFDLDREIQGVPAPIVCAKLSQDTDLEWLLKVLLPALHGGPLSSGQEESFRRCHREIPSSAQLLYVFSLLARGGETVRMEIFGLGPSDIGSYLRRVAPDTSARVTDLAGLFAGVERVHLSFDLGSEVLPRIGIEGSFHRLPVREPRWRELFDRLIDRGLCSAEERDAALAWPGYNTFWSAPAAWPIEAVGARGFCVRALSHVKVVSRPDAEPEAKLYLGIERLEERPSS